MKIRVYSNTDTNISDLIEAKNSNENKMNIYLDEVLGMGGEGVVYKARIDGKDIIAKKQDFNTRDLEISAIVNSLAASMVLSSYKGNGCNGCNEHIMCLLGIAVSSDRLPRFKSYIQNIEKNPELEKLVYSSNNIGYDDFFWLYEYIEGKPLESALKEEIDIYKYCKQLIEAVEIIHNKGIVHLDIKPGNVMVTTDGNLKIIDFGYLCKTTSKTCKIRGGTMEYSAPDIYIKPENNEERLLRLYKSDIFALGLTLYEIMTKQLGMPDLTGQDFMETNVGELDLKFTKETEKWKPLIQSMVKRNPEQRPNIHEVLQKFLLSGGKRIKTRSRRFDKKRKTIKQKNSM